MFATLSRAFPSPHRGEFGDDSGSSSLFIGTTVPPSQTHNQESNESEPHFVNSVLLPAMVSIPDGSFLIGDKKAHDVRLSGFFMSETEITNAQFCEFLNASEADGTIRDDWCRT